MTKKPGIRKTRPGCCYCGLDLWQVYRCEVCNEVACSPRCLEQHEEVRRSYRIGDCRQKKAAR